LVDECRFEVGFVTWSFFRIVPRQQKSASFRTEMEAVRHINYHRRAVREIIKRLRWNQHSAQRLDGQIDGDESCDLPCPGSGRVYHIAGVDRSARCFDGRNTFGVQTNSSNLGVARDTRAMAKRPGHEAVHSAVRIDK